MTVSKLSSVRTLHGNLFNYNVLNKFNCFLYLIKNKRITEIGTRLINFETSVSVTKKTVYMGVI